jgi:alkylation response protein AidB-like acyl-CoA dehydrogenase
LEFDYTEKQEEFRKEVRAWLDSNLPPDRDFPAEMEDLDDKNYALAKEFRAKLAKKGWLHPTYPKKYGGGGMDYDEHLILVEEFNRRIIPYFYDPSYIVGASLLAQGTEEQKEKWLPLIAQGKIVTWQCYTEPEAGTDLANVQTRFDRLEKGDFLVNGQKIYAGNGKAVDWLFTLVIDPSLPRHQNMTALMIKSDSPGVSYDTLEPIAGPRKCIVYFDDVHVPADNLIGEVNNGWLVANAGLAGERGSHFFVEPYHLFDEFFEYCKKSNINNPAIRELLVDLFLDAKCNRLLYSRTFWKASHGIPTSYEGSQNNLLFKLFMPKFGNIALEVLGPYALVTDPKWTVLFGRIENLQRRCTLTHGAGTPEAQKMIIARALGLSRTRRRKI